MSKTKTPAEGPPPRVRPEAELEAMLSDALTRAFPTIPRDQLHAQTRFKVKLGHKEADYDATWAWELGGRADVIIFHKERPLAVVEVKREDLELKDDDRAQAQSYANQTTPRPPLVILTNGRAIQIFDSSTGEPWEPDGDAEAAVVKLLENTAKVAAAGLRWAVEVLMGPEAGVWTEAVRQRTAELLAGLTDPAGSGVRPFADGLLYPRYATRAVIEHLREDAKVILVEGAPLVGKSSVLRELVLRTAFGSEFAVLMLRGAGGPGVFQRIANLFSHTLEWAVTADDVRQWLRRMSRFDYGPTLVLAIDGLEAGGAAAGDLEELADSGFGPRLKIVVATGDANPLLTGGNGRDATALAMQARRVEVGALNLPEFRRAKQILAKHDIMFMRGADYADDLRAPWVLRILYDRNAPTAEARPGEGYFLLPPSLGLELIDETRARFAEFTDLLRGYRLLARDALKDISPTSPELRLAASCAFVMPRDALSRDSETVLASLQAQGWIATGRHAGGEDIVVPTLPPLFLSELANAAADELEARAPRDARAAGVWLGKRLDQTYLGDLVGAQAVRAYINKTGSLSSDLLWGLLSIEPTEKLVENALIAFARADGSLQHIKIEHGKAWPCTAQGDPQGRQIDLGAHLSRMYGNTTAWMILGQLSRLPIGVVGQERARIDAQVLLKIGQCAFPLVRSNEEGLGHLELDLADKGRVLCLENGMIEATTHAMADLLSRDWEDADAWIGAAVETGSLPLLHRIMIALHAVRARARTRSFWAGRVLQEVIDPAIRTLIN